MTTAVAITAPAVVASMPAELLVRPPVNGTGGLLFLGATARLDGIALTFAGSTHKQVGRKVTSLFAFKVVKGGKKVEVHLTTEQERFQAEVVAHGALFVFEQRSNDVFTVVLAAAQAPAELDEPACIALIDDAAKRVGMTDHGASSHGSDQGILRLERKTWTAYCGRYTKRVWFGPPAAPGPTP